IVRGYTFISRNYEPGDSIHITGFSRGAYTARALAGMIAKVGLLNNKAFNANDKDKAYRRGVVDWGRDKGGCFQNNGGFCRFFTSGAKPSGGGVGGIKSQPSAHVS